MNKMDEQESNSPKNVEENTSEETKNYNEMDRGDRKKGLFSNIEKNSWRSSLTIVGILAAALVLAWGLVAFVFQQYQVEGPSMEPTLQNNNRLIVLKVPRTWARITGNPYIPSRGDVIIFNEKNLYGVDTGTTTQLVKRVIGLPGDHIVVKNGTYYVYNKQHPNGFEPDKSLSYGQTKSTANFYTTCTGDYCNLVVPKGEVFVSGDNRTNSYDSRDFGPVPASQIIGQLVLRITPVNELKIF